jgi:dihydrodipicolinate synthase/N-acetylneuraminate lyase
VGVTGAVVAVANVIPELLVDLFEKVGSGHHREALALQRAVAPLAAAVTSVGGVPALKAAMSLAGYRGGWPRAPIAPVTQAELQHIERLLRTLAVPFGVGH